MRRHCPLLWLTLLAQLCAPAAQGAPQDAAQLGQAIRQAALSLAPPGASIHLGSLAGAQYMPACSVPLLVSITGTLPYEQAAAHCAAPAWTLYVTLTVAQTESVIVAARPIVAGRTLTSGDVTLARESVALYAGRQVFYHRAQVLGANATMSLPAGAILDAGNIAEPVVVKAGQTVLVNVISGGVQVTLDALADQTGRIGDMILLTNPASGRRFPALVTANGPVVRLQ